MSLKNDAKHLSDMGGRVCLVAIFAKERDVPEVMSSLEEVAGHQGDFCLVLDMRNVTPADVAAMRAQGFSPEGGWPTPDPDEEMTTAERIQAIFGDEVPEVLKKRYLIGMPDGSKWSVPIATIALHRAESYKEEFGDDLARSLKEDTVPLFSGEEYEIKDWAANNMNWCDVEHDAEQDEAPAVTLDLDEGWCGDDWELDDG